MLPMSCHLDRSVRASRHAEWRDDNFEGIRKTILYNDAETSLVHLAPAIASPIRRLPDVIATNVLRVRESRMIRTLRPKRKRLAGDIPQPAVVVASACYLALALVVVMMSSSERLARLNLDCALIHRGEASRVQRSACGDDGRRRALVTSSAGVDRDA